MRSIVFCLSFLTFFVSSVTSTAQQPPGSNNPSQLIEYIEEGKSESEDTVQARQEAIQDAVEKVSMRLIREMIGDSKLDRQLTSIKAKILPQSEKYVPFIKTGTPRVSGKQTKITVTFKLSPQSLQYLLQQSGFLTSQDGPSILLPVVTFSDLVNRKALKWWVDDPENLNTFLVAQERVLNATVKTFFSKQGFQVLDPQTWQYKRQVPASLQLDSLRTQDYQSLGDNFKAQLVLKGDVRFEETKNSQSYKVVGKFVVLHTGNGRVIADSIRALDTEPGAFASTVPKRLQQLLDETIQDLASQVNEAWTKGTITASPVRLVIRDKLDYQTLENLKNEIRSNVRQVRSITERLFVSDGIELEVDVEGGAEALSSAFRGFKFKSTGLKLRDSRDYESQTVTLQ